MDKILGFFGIPSPALLLGILAALGAVAGWSYHLGDQAGANRVEAHYSVVKDKATDLLGRQLEAANERAVAAESQARAAADRQAAAQAKSISLLEDIRNAPRISPACFSPDFRMRVDADIRALNEYGNPKTGNAGGVPATVPRVP